MFRLRPQVHQFIWYSREESSEPHECPDQCYLSLHPILFDAISSFLDFHDLSLLLQTGDALLRRIILERTRSTGISGPFDESHASDVPLLPPQTFTILSAFQQLETLVLTSPNWKLPRSKESFLLMLPSSLRHLTLSGTQSDCQSVSVLMVVPWSTKFPLLETLRIFLNTDSSDPMPRLGRYLNAKSLPKSLRVLSLLIDLLLERDVLMKKLVHPIGYDSDTTTVNAQTAKTWTEAWNAHSASTRKSFTYTLPNLEFLELPNEVQSPDKHQEVASLPDLSVLPPTLHTLVYGCCRSVNPKRASLTRILSEREAAALSIGSAPPSALTTLTLAGSLPEGWLERAPPSVTRLALKAPSKDVNLGALFPHLREFRVLDGNPNGAHRAESLPLIHNNITLADLEGSQFESAAAPLIDGSAPCLWHLPATSLRKVTFDSHTPTRDLVFSSYNLLKNMTSLCLEVLSWHDFFSILPPTITRLSASSYQSPESLANMPQHLKTLTLISLNSNSTISATELRHLPSSLRYCRIQPVYIETNGAEVSSEQVSVLLASLPRPCKYALSFSTLRNNTMVDVSLPIVTAATNGTAMRSPGRW